MNRVESADKYLGGDERSSDVFPVVNNRSKETLDGRSERFHYSLVSWFALGFYLIYLLKISSAYSFLPVSLKIPLAGFMFCMGPGLALYTLLCLFRKSQFPFLTLFVLSCSLGLTFNFLANIVVFIFEPSLPLLTEVYLITVGILYGLILFYWKLSGIPLFEPIVTVNRRTLIFLVLGVFSIFYGLSLKTPTGLYVEELIILRKIFENPQITTTNIAFWKGEYTTYFFVPFYLLLAMSAQFTGIDVLEVADGMWPFTAGVSLLCLAALAWHLSKQWVTVGVLVVMGIIHALFLSQPMSNELTVFAPFPDRYALASGVLIPLVLVHFLIHMEHSRINIPAFVGLVYLIVEMTFIHARETLFFIGIVIVYSFIQAFDFKKNKADLVRIFFLLCIVAAILLIYRFVNLNLQPDLDGYLGRMREDMWSHFWRGLDMHGWLSLIGVPQFHSSKFWDSFQYAVYFKLGRSFPGYEFVSLTVCLLPLYVLAVNRPSLLLAPAGIAALGLFSIFQGLHLLVGIAVGAPFIFEIFSVLFLLSAIVFADMARMIGAVVFLPSESKYFLFGKSLFSLIGLVAVYEFLINFQPGYATGSLILEILVYLGTLICVAFRARKLCESQRGGVIQEQSLRPSFELEKRIRSALNLPSKIARTAEALAPTRKHLALALSIGCLVSGIGIVSQFSLSHVGGGRLPNSQTGESSDLSAIYNNLSRGQLFYHSRYHDWRLPPKVTQYIRTQVPPLQTWFGGHTLPVMLVSNQYAPLLSFSGRISIGFSANIFFLDRFYGPGTAEQRFLNEIHPRSDFTTYLKTEEETKKLFELLHEYGVQWIITLPEEKKTIEDYLSIRADIQSALELMFEADGFKIFKFKVPKKNNQQVVLLN